MIKIFQIGFHICGTRSLTYYFKNNNFASFHYEGGKLADQLFKNLKDGKTHFDPPFEGPFPNKQGVFYSDMERNIKNKNERLKYGDIFFKWEGYKLFKELDNYYENSYFILNLRNDWIKRKIEKNKEKGKKDFYTKEEYREFLESNYNEHIKNVRNYFKGRDNFIEFNIHEENISKISKWLKSKGFNINYNKFPKIRG